MRNLCLWVRYEGTKYHGFQQQCGCITVQQRLQEAVTTLTQHDTIVYGAGRTDAGVHARKQVVTFLTPSPLPLDRWCRGLNAHLPTDIVVWHAEESNHDFHARKSAHQKTYVYTIHNAPYADPLRAREQWHIIPPLDVTAMEQALLYVRGKHDFTSFCNVRSSVVSKVRTLHRAELCVLPSLWGEKGQIIRITFTGDGFLYQMVRILVGTLVRIGLKKQPPLAMFHVLKAKDRRCAGPTAKPHGLHLWDIDYDTNTVQKYE